MNFTQMHERLRQELLRRIQRGTVSVSLLARQTGFGQSHLSNFLHNRRQLSLEAMDLILAAQHMTAGDLLPAVYQREVLTTDGESSAVPVVSHAAALFEPFIRPSAAQSMLHLPSGLLQSIRTRVSNTRRAWQRFVPNRRWPRTNASVCAAFSAPLPLRCCRADLVVRRAFVTPGPAEQELARLGATAYLTSCSKISGDSARTLRAALAAFADAFVSTRR